MRDGLLPRTLLGRTVLVLVLAVTALQAVTLYVVRTYVTEEYSRALVRVGGNSLLAIRDGLRAMPAEARPDYAREVAQSTGYTLQPAVGNAPPPGVQVPLEGRIALLAARLRQRGMDTRGVWVVADGPGQRVWVRAVLPDGDWWISFERNRFDRAFPLGAAALLLASLGVAVLLAWTTVQRLNRPLRRIQANILRLGGGRPPEPVRIDGPAELQALAEAVNRMGEELARSGEERALMLAGVSHDLRTPLSRLRLGVEMMAADAPQDREAMVEDIEEIDRILGQFLDFAREGQVPQGSLIPDDLAGVVQDCVARFRLRTEGVTGDAAPGLVMPMRRPAIERLLGNLVENALRYAGPEVLVQARREADGLVLAVLDRGPGVGSADRARMTQPFTRLNPSRSGPAGAGLGLAIVERIARSHGGSLHLLDRPGGGLQVEVRFSAGPVSAGT